jgi:hypothetical protein
VWEVFLGGVGIDAWDIEKLLEGTGLAVWRPATEEEIAEYAGWELEPGDNMLCLTEEGRAVVREGRVEPKMMWEARHVVTEESDRRR